jgi:hypothetical protein
VRALGASIGMERILLIERRWSMACVPSGTCGEGGHRNRLKLAIRSGTQGVMEARSGALSLLVLPWSTELLTCSAGSTPTWKDLGKPHLILLAARIRLAETTKPGKDKHAP